MTSLVRLAGLRPLLGRQQHHQNMESVTEVATNYNFNHTVRFNSHHLPLGRDEIVLLTARHGAQSGCAPLRPWR